jgi:hypothetical protein
VRTRGNTRADDRGSTGVRPTAPMPWRAPPWNGTTRGLASRAMSLPRACSYASTARRNARASPLERWRRATDRSAHRTKRPCTSATVSVSPNTMAVGAAAIACSSDRASTSPVVIDRTRGNVRAAGVAARDRDWRPGLARLRFVVCRDGDFSLLLTRWDSAVGFRCGFRRYGGSTDYADYADYAEISLLGGSHRTHAPLKCDDSQPFTRRSSSEWPRGESAPRGLRRCALRSAARESARSR